MLSLPSHSEVQELVIRIKSNDREAFNELFHHYRAPLFQFIHRYVKITEYSEDILQDTFLKIWEVRSSLKPELNFTAYLYKISRNLVFRFLKNAASMELMQQQVLYHYRYHEDESYLKLQWKQYEEAIHKATQLLPEKRQQVFRLCREQNKTYEEVSQLLGISRNTVKEHMVMAMKSITAYMKKHTGMFVLFTLSLLYIQHFILR